MKKTTTELVFHPEKSVRRIPRANRIYCSCCFHGLYGNISWSWKIDKRMVLCLMHEAINRITWAQLHVSDRAILRH